jgi:DNA-3-methyladenine glycosylase II
MIEHPAYPADIDKAVRKLKKSDPILKKVIERVGPCKLRLENNAFHILARSIVFQQLSVAAAGTIFNRLMVLTVQSSVLTPENILNASLDELRKCGISRPKCRYLKDLAQKFNDQLIKPEEFNRMSNEEIIEQLTTVKGIGKWTVEMFLIFSLGRLDVIPVDDVGLQRAMKLNYRLRSPVTPEKIKKIARNWGQYSSVASWYLWRSLKD